MKKLSPKTFLMSDSYHYWAHQGALMGLLVSGLLTGVVLTLMLGMWFEFSAASHEIFFNTDKALAYDGFARVTIMKSNDLFNVDDVLLIFSSRDSDALYMIFAWWRWSFYSALGGTLCWGVIVLIRNEYKKIIPFFVAGVGYWGAQFATPTLPQKLDVSYLLEITSHLFLILASYITIHYVQKRITFNAQHQTGEQSTLIAYASQSGTAKSIALKMASSSHVDCDIRDFSQLTPQCLLSYNQLFVVASTYGEGQAPEKSASFSRALTLWKNQLDHLSYAVLALGDRAYPQFCAFGHHIDNLLNNKGATAMRPIQEIDRGDPLTITHWWQNIGELLGWNALNIKHDFVDGVITSNQCLNESQAQRHAHAITITVANVNYQAGDLLEVITPVPLDIINDKLLKLGFEQHTLVDVNNKSCQLNEALTQLEWTSQIASSPQALVDKLSIIRPRVYSIASAPTRDVLNKNQIKLLVRKLIKDDGSAGFSSSALCHAQLNQSFQVAIRAHDSFRLPNLQVPIIMIAAGTGLAPFMSFLAQRHLEKNYNNWLIFGEQFSEHDNYFNRELDAYVESGVLNQLDYAFSRDDAWLELGKPRYVGDVMSFKSQQLSDWVLNKGAHIYVCGNRNGMGEAVKSALKDLFIHDYESLKQAHRLHFDLY